MCLSVCVIARCAIRSLSRISQCMQAHFGDELSCTLYEWVTLSALAALEQVGTVLIASRQRVREKGLGDKTGERKRER